MLRSCAHARRAWTSAAAHRRRPWPSARSVATTSRPIARLSRISAGAYSATSGQRAYATSSAFVPGDIVQAVLHLPIQIGRRARCADRPARGDRLQRVGRARVGAAIERRKVSIHSGPRRERARWRAPPAARPRAGRRRRSQAPPAAPASDGTGGRTRASRRRCSRARTTR